MSNTSSRRRDGPLQGLELLRNPVLNKGTAFTEQERDRHGLRGLLPPHVHTIDEQLMRVREGLDRQPDDLLRYIYLTSLHDRNETLFFRTLMEAPDELIPIVYTPTVGLACQRYGHILQQPRGLYLSIKDKGRVAEVLRNWPWREVGIIVVTDGERILGLGDLGTNGMGIPIGKLSLYTACAGVDPIKTLPVTLDVGTDNPELLADALYIGLRQKRVRNGEYDAFVDEFVAAANSVFPGVMIQFEDFANVNAFRLLQRYRDRVCSFNDDIQGTASVTLAGIYSALRITGGKLRDQTLLCLGAGEAATGICDLIVAAMVREGLPRAEARRRCWLVDSKGLVVEERTDLTAHKKPYAHPHAQSDFLGAVRSLRPTALIGASGQPNAFTIEVLSTMADVNSRPIVFALSNPTSKSECTAEQAYGWTHGRAIFASGSPFAPVNGFVPGQANNAYVFPGIGLGVLASRATRVSDEMFAAAARTLAAQVSEADLAIGRVYPALSRIRDVSAHIAAAVAEVAYESGFAGKPRPVDVLADVRAEMYWPQYE